MIGNAGAKQAMEWLFDKSGEKINLDHLLAKKFTKADIVKMIGNNGAKQVMQMAFCQQAWENLHWRSFIRRHKIFKRRYR